MNHDKSLKNRKVIQSQKMSKKCHKTFCFKIDKSTGILKKPQSLSE